MSDLKPIQKLKPFTHFCMTIGNLPSSYLESMTYYEQILWFIKFLEDTVIPTINNNSEAVEELQQLYIQLKNFVDNYFENLDVQEEINNKLDEMAESGELEEIISAYLTLNSIIVFNTVSDLISADNLINNSTVKTLGYYSINDGGGASYKIKNSYENNDEYITLNNNLYAILQLNNDEIIANQFGCKSNDETFNNHDIIIKMLNYAKNNKKTSIKFLNGIYYTTPLSLNGFNNIKISGKTPIFYSDYFDTSSNTILKCLNGAGNVFIQLCDIVENTQTHGWACHNIKLENIVFDCDEKIDYCINGNFSIELNNCAFIKANLDGIVLENYTYPFFIKNCYSLYNKRHGLHSRGNSSTVFNVENSEFSRNGAYGIYLTSGATCSFYNCVCQANKAGALKLHKLNRQSYLQNITFYNFYTEANGTLQSNEPYYEGNYNIYIKSEELNNNETSSKPKDIKFLNSALNISNSLKQLYCNAVWNLSFIDCEGYFLENYCEINKTYSNIIREHFNMVEPETISNTGITTSTAYKKNNKNFINYEHGGIISKEGNIQILKFSSPKLNTDASNILDTCIPNQFQKSYPIDAPFIILRAGIYKRRLRPSVADEYKDQFAGTITAIARYLEYNSYGNMRDISLDNLQMDLSTATNKLVASDFNIQSATVYAPGELALKFETSQDYNCYDNANASSYTEVEGFIVIATL